MSETALVWPRAGELEAVTRPTGESISMVEFKHIAIPTQDIARSSEFYRDVFGFEAIETPTSQYPMTFKWHALGPYELHIMQVEPNLDTSLGIPLNPTAQPHFAVKVDDAGIIKRNLEEHGVDWIDWGKHGIPGWNQFFVVDPDGNVIEIESFDD